MRFSTASISATGQYCSCTCVYIHVCLNVVDTPCLWMYHDKRKRFQKDVGMSA